MARTTSGFSPRGESEGRPEKHLWDDERSNESLFPDQTWDSLPMEVSLILYQQRPAKYHNFDKESIKFCWIELGSDECHLLTLLNANQVVMALRTQDGCT